MVTSCTGKLQHFGNEKVHVKILLYFSSFGGICKRGEGGRIDIKMVATCHSTDQNETHRWIWVRDRKKTQKSINLRRRVVNSVGFEQN